LANAFDVNQLVYDLLDINLHPKYFDESDKYELEQLKNNNAQEKLLELIIHRISFFGKKRLLTNERSKLLNLAHRVLDISKNKLYRDFYSDLININMSLYIEIPIAYEFIISVAAKGTTFQKDYEYSKPISEEKATEFYQKYFEDDTFKNSILQRFDSMYIEMMKGVLTRS
jgi:hypothetical protein